MSGPASALLSLLGVKNSMVDFLLDQLSTEGEFVITAEEVIEPDDGTTAIQGLKIADAKGVWFTADRLDFSWNPSRLLRGEIEFSNLAMVGVRVLRQPEGAMAIDPEGAAKDAQPEQTDSPFAWPRAPLTVRIERMALDGVSFEKAVLGHAIQFTAEGSARDEGDIQAVKLRLTRTDAIAGTIDFDYSRNFSANTLAVNLSASEAAGGLVADVAGLPDDAASQVTLKASGPPTDWRVDFSLALADLISAQGKAKVAYEGPVEVDADFIASPGRNMAPEVAAMLGREARLTAKAKEGRDGTVKIEDGLLTSRNARLQASGQLNRNTSAMDFALALQADSALADAFDGIGFGGATFDGRLAGTPGALAANGRMKVDRLTSRSVDVARADWTIAFTQTAPDRPSAPVANALSIAGKTQGLRLDKIPASTIGTADVALDAVLEGNALTLETVLLESDALVISAAGTGNVETTDATLSFSVFSDAMQAIAGAYGVDVSGAIEAAGFVTLTSDVTNIQAEATLTQFAHEFADAEELRLAGSVALADSIMFALNGEGTKLRLDRITADLLPSARLSAKGTLAEDLLRLEGLRLTSPLIGASAEGRYDLGSKIGDLRYSVSTENLGRVARLYDAPVSGALRADGRAELPGDGPPRLTGKADAVALVLDGTRYGTVSLTHDVTVSEEPSGQITLRTSAGPVGAVRAKAQFRYAAPSLTLSGLDAQALGLSAQGDLAVNISAPLAAGKLALSSGSLTALGRVVGVPLSGAARGTVTLSHKGGRQNASVNLTGRNISAEDIGVGALRLRGSISNALAAPSVNLTASVQDATGLVDGLTIAQADLSAKGPLARLDVTATATGSGPAVPAKRPNETMPLALSAAARINAVGATRSALVSRLEARLGPYEIRQQSPLRISARGAAIGLKGLNLLLPAGGRMAGDLGLRNGAPTNGDLQVQIPDLAALGSMFNAPVSKGKATATIRLDTPKRRGSATINAAGVVFKGAEDAGALDLTANADWQGRVARTDANLTGRFGEPVRATATLPITVRGGLPQIAKSGPIDANIAWQGTIDQLWAQVPAPGHVLTGKAVVDLGVSGDIANPQITGSARVEQGGYQNLDLGTILTDLSIATTLSPDGDLGVDVRGSDGAKGKVTAKGTVALDPPALALTTDVTQAVLVRRDDVTARIGGKIDVQGPMNRLAVTGGLTIQEAEVRLVNNNPPGIATLGDVIIKGQEDLAEAKDASTTTLDLSVDAPGRMFVRGRGLDSTWGMGLKIGGTAAEPRITGRIERVRGQLDLIGKAFNLTRGRIDFDGGTEIDPRVDVILERETSDLTGRIIVEGRASDPQLRFSSRPAVPEDEVLPRTLFGKSSQALTGSQAIQLGIGLATLMDGGAGTLDSVRSAVGLDSLRIEQDEEGNAAIAVGKEVAEGVWVGSKQSLGEGGTSVAVEIDVFEDVILDTEISPGGDASIGIEWKKDF